MSQIYSVFTGTGSYIPEQKINNRHFLNHNFFDESGQAIDTDIHEIVEKLRTITDIENRRYVTDELVASDIAFEASQKAIADAGIDKETIDYIILAHNFGDVRPDTYQINNFPTLATKVKEKLKIENPRTVAYDITFGCPGWILGIIQANYYIKAGDAKRVLVVATDTLSRISDPHDRDCMIFADGAGACIMEAVESDVPIGFLSHSIRTDTLEHAYDLMLGGSYNKDFRPDSHFIKMNGRKLYNYALTTVPPVVKESIDKANIKHTQVKKILIHQANAKMDEAILKRIFREFNDKNVPEDIMPMSIRDLGNSSVATVPTLLDLILKGEKTGHTLESGDYAVLASVGAGMNVNSVVYKFP